MSGTVSVQVAFILSWPWRSWWPRAASSAAFAVFQIGKPATSSVATAASTAIVRTKRSADIRPPVRISRSVESLGVNLSAGDIQRGEHFQYCANHCGRSTNEIVELLAAERAR